MLLTFKADENSKYITEKKTKYLPNELENIHCIPEIRNIQVAYHARTKVETTHSLLLLYTLGHKLGTTSFLLYLKYCS